MGAIDVDAHIDEVSNGSGEKKRSLKEVLRVIKDCVSSFSAFVKRERDVSGLPSSFWAFKDIQNKKIEL